MSGSYLSVYRLPELSEVYGFTTLRTDSQGQTSFTLTPGKYFYVLTTNQSSLSSNKSTPIIVTGFFDTFRDSLSATTIKIHKNIYPGSITLTNFPKVPYFKVEASVNLNGHETHPHGFAVNFQNESKLTFFASEADYNINLDIIKFTDKEPLSFALASKNQIQKSSSQINIIYDYQTLRKKQINIKNSIGWVKTIGSFGGDFQSMSFSNSPTSLLTNQTAIFPTIVYIPAKSCVDSFRNERSDESDVINVCNHTNLRYELKRLDQPAMTDQFTFYPPEYIQMIPDCSSLLQGEYLRLIYYYSNQYNQKYQATYIHQLWDQKVVPKIEFINGQGKVVLTTSIDRYDNYNQYGQICLEPGTYTLKATLNGNIWGPSLLTGNTVITIKPGTKCQTSDFDSKTINIKDFTSWQELYQKRSSIPPANFLKISNMSLGANHLTPDFSQVTEITNCQDFSKVKPGNSLLLIKLNQQLANSIDDQQKFNQCLLDFTKSHSNINFILSISNSVDQAFSGPKPFLYYFYYRIIKQNPFNYSGIQIDVFSDFFQGSADFYFVNTDQFSITNYFGSLSVRDNLSMWIKEYQSLIPQIPVYYYSQ